MILSELLKNIEIVKTKGNLEIDITNIHSDSRKIKQNGLFVAINGFTKNGIEFIPSAIENGAIALIVEPDIDIDSLDTNLPVISVKNTRQALSILSCTFYDNPSKKLKLIGVTGTKGKTTSSFMIKSILQKQGYKVGLMGSIAIYINDEKVGDMDRTTAESIEIQKTLDMMVKENVDIVVLEVSSQAMKLDRVTGCEFDVSIFTNLTEDHISPKEHPNMEDYFNCKLELLKISKVAVINNDDEKVKTISSLLPNKKIITFGIDNPADITANPKSIKMTNSEIDFEVKLGEISENIVASIPGKFSIYNSLGAIAVASEFGANMTSIKSALSTLKVLGRNELVPNNIGLSIIIDYAHTPSSLESILTSVKSYAKGRVICAWGVGGDRDKAKRPIMGEISGRLADFTVLMSDQVRTEDPLSILKDIEVGIIKTGKPYKIVVDRTEGIRYAISIANPGDTIVIPGLGHDLYLEKNGVKYPYNEREVIKNIINEMIASGEKTII